MATGESMMSTRLVLKIALAFIFTEKHFCKVNQSVLSRLLVERLNLHRKQSILKNYA